MIVSRVDSTNNYAMAKLRAGLIGDGWAVLAAEQTAGKGQRNRGWTAEPNANITMSTVFRAKPDTNGTAGEAGPAASPHSFRFSALVALACYDFIKSCGLPDVSIKWPNDIWIVDKKAAGILIEHQVAGKAIAGSVVGIGVNVNQVQFPPDLPHAGSLRQVTGRVYDVPALARSLHQVLFNRIRGSAFQPTAHIMEEYNQVLYRRGLDVRLRKEQVVFASTIEGVNDRGELVTRDAVERTFRVGEVEFVH